VAIHDTLVDDPSGSPGVPRRNDGRRERQHNGDCRQPGSGRAREECSPGGGLDVRRVDDDEPASGKSTLELAMEDRERQPRHPLICGVA
jgi:hypothetical protein